MARAGASSRTAVNTPGFGRSAAAALLIPLAVMTIFELWYGSNTWALMPIQWLYMVGPQLVVTFVGAVNPPARRGAWKWLLMLTILLVIFLLWSSWQANEAEQVLAWILYYPFVLAAVLTYVVARFVWQDFHQGVHTSDSD